MEACLKIKGGKMLEGEVEIAGSKNLCVALIPAALLSRDIVILNNIPMISDVENLINILRALNVTAKYCDGQLTIDSSNIKYLDLNMVEMTQLRASYYFYSVMLNLFSHLIAKPAGGCSFGKRPINLHLDAFTKLGVIYSRSDNGYEFNAQQLLGQEIVFPFSSVGATINAAVLALNCVGKTTIYNAALEPEVTELLLFLKAMGAKIENIGTSTLVIYGGANLHGCTFSNIPDRIEVGTYALIGASCAKRLRIKNVVLEHITSLLKIFDLLKIDYQIDNNDLIVKKTIPSGELSIKTAPYPGFPTDLQQPLTAYLSCGRAKIKLQEDIYINRFAHIKELKKMGANIKLHDNTLEINGVPSLKGTVVDGYDLRGGASLVIACLIADGESIVRGLKYINRGYDNIIYKLQKLHAAIELCQWESEL